MARYRVSIGARAEDDLLAIPFPFRRALHQRIMRLREVPRPVGWEQVGAGGNAALVVHGYELLFTIDDESTTVTVVAILPRQR
mgnify:CR=1 FL=1